jgi:glycosyltransferase involved in cell wall biosynthesis
MIKICMIVHQYYYRDPRVRRYAEALADLGVKVDIICPRDPDQPPTSQRDAIRVVSIPLSRGYRQRGNYLFEYALAFVLFTIWLLGLYLKNRYQVIHVNNVPDFLVFAGLIPKMFGAKLILDIHDPMPEFYASKYQSKSDSKAIRLIRVEERLSTWLAHAVITANANFKNNLIKRGTPASKITVVQNLPDPKVFNRNKYRERHEGIKEHFTLIYPGTIAPRYGLDVAIHALPLLVTKIPQLCLLIIGPSVGYVAELVKLAEELGVSSFVRFEPTIPVEEVPLRIIAADVGIYPALRNAHTNIAMPTKVLEYAAMGIPIISSRLQVLEDLFSDSAIMFFEPGNVSEFARCVLELHTHPTRRDELVRNADSIFVRTHSWKNELSAYLNVLNQLLSQGEQVFITSDRNERLPN